MTPALEQLYRRQDLSALEAEKLFTQIFNGETDPAVFASKTSGRTYSILF